MRAIYWAAVFFYLSGVASGREWTSNVGTKVEGELIALDDDIAVLKIKSEEKRVPLDKLSPIDQAFARQRGGELDRAAKLVEAGGPGIIRTWKDNAGAEVEAKFGEMRGNMAVLLVNRAPAPVAYAFLSPADQLFVRAAVEAKLKGTWLFPTAEGAIPAQRSFGGSRSAISVTGSLVGLDHNGSFILQTRNGLQAFPAAAFDIDDEAHIREEFKIRGLSDLLPRDSSAHEFTDWKGEKFRARINPTRGLTNFLTRVYFVYEGKEFEREYEALCEADQRYLRQLAVSKGVDVARWPEIVPDARHPVRTWTLASAGQRSVADPNAPSRSTEGAFISYDAGKVDLRAESHDGVKSLYLRSLSLEDRLYLAGLLETESNKVLPIYSVHCAEVAFDFHEGGVSNVAIYPVAVSNGEVSAYLPEHGTTGVRTKPCAISLAALTPASIDRIRQHLQLSNPNQVVDDPPSVPTVAAVESRSWQLANNQTARGGLKYVSSTGGRITLDSGTRFSLIEASPTDQAYVVQAILDLGYARFERPPPPPPKPQVARSNPPPSNSGNRGMRRNDWSPPKVEYRTETITIPSPSYQSSSNRNRSRNQKNPSDAYMTGYHLGACMRVVFGFAVVISIVIAAIKKFAG